jgi:hypothetical protein
MIPNTIGMNPNRIPGKVNTDSAMKPNSFRPVEINPAKPNAVPGSA